MWALCRHPASGFQGSILALTGMPIHLNNMPVSKQDLVYLCTTLIKLILIALVALIVESHCIMLLEY
jgi:hypothetical protein